MKVLWTLQDKPFKNQIKHGQLIKIIAIVLKLYLVIGRQQKSLFMHL